MPAGQIPLHTPPQPSEAPPHLFAQSGAQAQAPAAHVSGASQVPFAQHNSPDAPQGAHWSFAPQTVPGPQTQSSSQDEQPSEQGATESHWASPHVHPWPEVPNVTPVCPCCDHIASKLLRVNARPLHCASDGAPQPFCAAPRPGSLM